jgi:ribosomal protein S20
MEGGLLMSTAKTEVQSLLEKLPDDCTLEDIQYHLYVVEKVHRGIDRAAKEGEISQQDVEKRLSKWNAE